MAQKMRRLPQVFAICGIVWTTLTNTAFPDIVTAVLTQPGVSAYFQWSTDASPVFSNGKEQDYPISAAEVSVSGDPATTPIFNNTIAVINDASSLGHSIDSLAFFGPDAGFNYLIDNSGTALSSTSLPTSITRNSWDVSNIKGITTDPLALIKSNLPTPQAVGPNGIQANFAPKLGGLPVNPTLLARAAGFDHFQWLSTVVHLPVFEDGYDPLDQAGNLLTPNFFDPPPGGYLNYSGGTVFDTLPYYYDEAGYGGTDPSWLITNSKFTNDQSVHFEDAPSLSFAKFNTGDYVEFITELVGVKDDPSQYTLLGGFSWASNFQSLTQSGGTAFSTSIPDVAPTGLGGVTILNSNLQLDAVPAEVLAFWVANGAVLDAGTAATPEPATVVIWSGLGLGALFLRKGPRRRLIAPLRA